MVNYQFDRKKNPDPVELKGKIHKVSYFCLIRHTIFTILQGLNIMYQQYLLFHGTIDNELHYRITILIFFASALVVMQFSVRIFIINQESNLKTILGVTALYLLVHTCYSYFMPITISYFSSTLSKFIFTHIFSLLLLLLQLTTFLRQVFATKCVIEYKQAERNDQQEDQQKYYELLIRAEADADLVNVLECYLRSALQQIGLVAIIFYNHGKIISISDGVLQQMSILIPFVRIPWSTTSFQGSLRRQQDNELGIKTKLVYFLWHCMLMMSRILSIGGAMAFWPVYTAVAVLIHWVVAVIWLCWSNKPTQFCNNNKFWHAAFCSVFGVIYIFTPINLSNQPTRCKYISFYCISFVQNFIATLFWFISENDMSVEYKIALVFINSYSFVWGIVIMILYYERCHPTKDIKETNITEKLIIRQEISCA